MTTSPTPAELRELGLYDPDAPDAAERLDLLRLAFEHGATVGEVRTAIEEMRLHAVAAERLILAGSDRCTLQDAAGRAGVDLETGERIWRALGFAATDDASLVCTDADVGVLAFFALATQYFGAESAIGLARTTGATMSRLADSSIASARAVLEAPIREEGGTNLQIAHAFIDVTADLIPRLYPMLEAVNRRHLVDAARRYSLWGAAPTSESTTDAVIGFADMVGYTSLALEVGPTGLDELVGRFEERALAAVAWPDARVVKTIGDEVMFVAGDAGHAVEIARRLVDDPAIPPLRIGLAAGEVVVRDGDCYGPVVNLASRIVARAEPGRIVMDGETVARLRGVDVSALGAFELSGIEAPVELFVVER